MRIQNPKKQETKVLTDTPTMRTKAHPLKVIPYQFFLQNKMIKIPKKRYKKDIAESV